MMKKKKIAIVIACISAISIYITIRKRRNTKSTTCYLHLQSHCKPQYSFKRLFLDNSFSPFKHLHISHSSPVQPANVHPYETEILKLLNEFQISFSFFNEISLTGMKESFVWVNSKSQLKELVELLGKQNVFAVDTEQHSLRSFLGFTALVQISTVEEDYVIDTIALHDIMDMLRSVFADPCILKVFHGADNDILWLQRDFHIYVVNLFDTAKACEVLSKPQKSLAYLLETYCGVTTNKLLQREDWRQRPLSEEMVVYARSDAHYLLYISRCLIEELRVKDNDLDVPENSVCQNNQSRFLVEASRRSNTSCLQLYAKESEELPGESAASSILSRNLTGQGITSQKSSDAQFQNRVRRLCAWRDLMARIHDESLRYVLSDMAIVAIADKNPTSEKKIYDTILQADQMCDSPSPSSLMLPSPIVCSHWEDVLCLLKDGESTSDDIFRELLKKHLGPNGTCPLSIYNYNLLSKCNWKLESRSVSLQNGVKSRKQDARKSSRELFVKKFSCKAPVYHNCRIYASDGRLLCYCDKKKLDWYISRNLAKVVDDNPPAIMLLFEPKGRPEDEDNDFYIQSKRNMCVGCGERNHYLRYRIIPSCYRIHFPEHLKSHRSHDIVLLCVDCHEVAHAAAEKYKRKIATEFGIPLYVRKVVDSTQKQLTETPESDALEEAGVSPLQLRTAAMALLRHGQRMPPKRSEELMEIVKTYYGGRDVSHEDLEAALLVGMSPHGRRRFKKKKGLSIKQSAGSGAANSSGTNGANASLDTTDETSIKLLSNESEAKVEKPPSVSSEIERRASTCDDTFVILCSDEISVVKDVNLLGAEGNCKTGLVVKGTSKPCVPGTDEGKYHSKVSLLGHGPHGKEVVTHLLTNYGEDGICQFCQRWRQVFFDAVNPRFLPAGWDINHSGRRDFGEFSVYKPAKKPADANEG